MDEHVQEIFTKNSFLIILSSADEDSLSSGILLKRILRSKGKKVRVIHDGEIPRRFLYIPYVSEVEIEDPSEVDYDPYDVVITVDAGSLKQIMGVSKVEGFQFPDHLETLTIDHHLVNTHYTKDYIYDPHASSTAELIYSYFVHPDKDTDIMHYDLSKDEATLLLIGIIGDTGFFKWSMTKRVLAIAQYLLEKGADNLFITNYMCFNKDFRLHAFLSYVLPKIEFYPEIKCNLLVVSLDDAATMGIDIQDVHLFTRPFHEMFTSIYEGYEYGGIMIEGKDKVVGSFRGNPYVNKVDLSALCHAISQNGGGHFNSAGFVITGVSLTECKKRVLDTMTEMYEKTH